jgi:DEAD/DEAH box helicase domain-containing protein
VLRVLRVLLGKITIELTTEPDLKPAPPPPPPPRKHGITRARFEIPPVAASTRGDAGRVLVFDLETQRSAEDVGGWECVSKMGLALAVVYDVTVGAYRTYFEADIDRLLLDLAFADRVVGFNIDRFDLEVLSGYTDRDLGRIRTLDLLTEIHRSVGFRVSLSHLSETNLGEAKAGDGLQSLKWWKEGRLDLIEHYCRKDVEVTKRLWEMGRSQGYLLHRDKAGRRLRLPAGWS